MIVIPRTSQVSVEIRLGLSICSSLLRDLWACLEARLSRWIPKELRDFADTLDAKHSFERRHRRTAIGLQVPKFVPEQCSAHDLPGGTKSSLVLLVPQ